MSESIDAVFADLTQNTSPGAATGATPGLAVAVLHRGEVIHRFCHGLADLSHGVAISGDTRFHLVSATKPFTAAAILLLEARGLLGLDHDIRAYLPELPTSLFSDGTIFIRQLLDHTSGLRDGLEILRLRGEWHPSPSRERDILDLAFAQPRLNAPPGTRHIYCNAGYVLLAEIVRRVSGAASADAYRREAIYEPLGMAATGARASDDMVLPNLATGYAPSPEGGWRIGTNLLGISGDVVTSTLDDMVRWLGAWRDGSIDGVPVFRRMGTPSQLARGDANPYDPPPPLHYGLGMYVKRYRGLPVWCHPGSQPGWKSFVAYMPQRDFGVVMLANRDDAGLSARFPALVDAVVGDTLSRRHPSEMAALHEEHTFIHMDKPDRIDGVYANAGSGELVWLRMRRGGFDVETLGDPIRLWPDGYGRFADADDFSASQPMELGFEQTAPDQQPVCRMRIGGWRGRFTKAEPPALDAADLRAYAGRYESAEHGTVHEVLLPGPGELGDHVGLWIRYGAGADRSRTFPLEPIAPDLFLARPSAPGVAHKHVFVFERGEDGAVTATHVTMERLKRVRLAKRNEATG